MDRLILALEIGIPIGILLTVAQFAITRLQILRGLRRAPPPINLSHRERYLTKPLLSTVGVAFPLTMLMGMCFAATLLTFVVLAVVVQHAPAG